MEILHSHFKGGMNMTTPRNKGRIFYISDLHLYHGNLLHPRDESTMATNLKARKQFSSVDEMHELIKRNWNEKVTDDDTVYILGDLGVYHADEIADFINSLTGTKILIKGNLDRWNLNESKRLRRAFADIRSYMVIKDRDDQVVLFHYPIEQWDGYYRGYYHVHGHTHGDQNLSTIPGRFEVCVEVTDYTPMTLEELKNSQNHYNHLK